ncbi:MAG: hypothetical protein AB8B85_22745 [Paracoccaceae bacterium]
MIRPIGIAVMTALMLAGAGEADSGFRHGNDIAAEMLLVGPLYSHDRGETGAFAGFQMADEMPLGDDVHLAAETGAACRAFREDILEAAIAAKNKDHSLIVIQFSWPPNKGELSQRGVASEVTNTYRAGNCAALN